MKTTTNNKPKKIKVSDYKQFWLAVFLCVAGVALLFTGMFLGVEGEIAGSVIGGAGELFLTAGAILGINASYGSKLTDIIQQIKREENENKGTTE